MILSLFQAWIYPSFKLKDDWFIACWITFIRSPDQLNSASLHVDVGSREHYYETILFGGKSTRRAVLMSLLNLTLFFFFIIFFFYAYNYLLGAIWNQYTAVQGLLNKILWYTSAKWFDAHVTQDVRSLAQTVLRNTDIDCM